MKFRQRRTVFGDEALRRFLLPRWRELDAERRADILTLALATLPEPWRSVLLASRTLDTWEALAQELGLSVRATRVAWHRARRHVLHVAAAALEGEGAEGPGEAPAPVPTPTPKPVLSGPEARTFEEALEAPRDP